MADRHNIRIDQGATFKRTIEWKEPLVDVDDEPILDENGDLQPGDPIDLTGWKIRMHIRDRVSAPDPPELELTTENGGITVETPATDGIFTVEATPEQTELLTRSGVYDLELVSPDESEVHRILEGKVRLSREVTRVEP